MAIREGKVVSRSDGAHDAQRGLHIFHMRTTAVLARLRIQPYHYLFALRRVRTRAVNTRDPPHATRLY